MTMWTAEAKPECRSVQSSALVKDVWCTIHTARVDIFIKLLISYVTMYDAGLTRVKHFSMAIPGAVLNVKLEEKLLENSDPSAHILQLAELRIQNISSIIDDIKHSIPKAETPVDRGSAVVTSCEDFGLVKLENMFGSRRVNCNLGVAVFLSHHHCMLGHSRPELSSSFSDRVVLSKIPAVSCRDSGSFGLMTRRLMVVSGLCATPTPSWMSRLLTA
ncbi:unnamed protein product, partial [Dibothriocephalus latus]